jgi:hypothetical protein
MPTTTYTFDQLIEDVRKEAEALRVHATKEELGRLDISKLDPTKTNLCVYGLMSGHCNSDRAVSLIKSCARRYVKTASICDIKYEGFEQILKIINGETVDDLQESRKDLFEDGHYSAIEAYILLPEAKNAKLIAFLKGETDNLEL